LECADNGGALDFFAPRHLQNPKRRRTALAAALQMYLPEEILCVEEMK
jgi:hypothetical protein